MSLSTRDRHESRRVLRRSLEELRRRPIAVLYGAVSPEDRLYSDECPREEWSVTLILEAMRHLGLTAEHLDPTSDGFIDEVRDYDLVFINLHGEYGEDGRIQGLLDYLELPYTGPGVLASSVGCDKPLTKSAFQLLGIPTPAFALLEADGEDPSGGLDFPLMLKAANGGSSVATLLVRDRDELATDAAELRADGWERLLVEEFIDGESVTVGLLDLPTGTALLPPLLCQTDAGFYDRDAKLRGSGTTYSVASDLPEQLCRDLGEAALATYRFLACRGFARVDFIVRSDPPGLWALEVNTIPGLQRMSNFVVAAQAIGLDYEEIILALLHDALQSERALPWRATDLGAALAPRRAGMSVR